MSPDKKNTKISTLIDNDLSTQILVDQTPSYSVIVEDIDEEGAVDNDHVIPFQNSVTYSSIKNRGKVFRPVTMVGSGVILIGAALTINWLIHLVETHRILAMPIGLGATLVLLGLGWLGFNEVRTIVNLRSTEVIHKKIERLSATNAPWTEAAAAVLHVVKLGTVSQRKKYDELKKLMESNSTAERFFSLFERDILVEMDKVAETAITRAVRDTFFLTVLAQTPIIDTVAFTLRAFMLLREVAYSYGSRPGPLGKVRIMVAALKNVATVSLTDILITDLVGAAGAGIEQMVDGVATAGAAIGGGVMSASVAAGVKGLGRIIGVISEKAAEDIAIGTVSARRMALFGFLVIGTCRPMPLGSNRRKETGQAIRKELVNLIKSSRKK